ncbi:MAG: glycosyltransferase [Acidobacteriia bacterium]|nr:glycosyltransferase [Terriglobia bacterium]
MPTLSVIVPAYNVAPFIRTALNSVLEQRFRDLEVIVINDGSSDETGEIVSNIKDDRVRLVCQVNGGLAHARNVGIGLAKGRYIAFLDGDDMWLPGYADCHVAHLAADRRVGISFNYQAYMDENSVLTGQYLTTAIARPSLRQLMTHSRIVTGNIIMPRECLDQVGGFDERLRACEDLEMWIRVLAKTQFQAELVPRVLCAYRERSNSLTMQFEHHIINARVAADVIESYAPTFRGGMRRRMLGEVYRILARKALSNNDLKAARHLALEALKAWPRLPLQDARAAGTLGLIAIESLMPFRGSRIWYGLCRSAMKFGYRMLLAPRPRARKGHGQMVENTLSPTNFAETGPMSKTGEPQELSSHPLGNEHAAAVLSSYLRYTPILWALGFLLPVGALTMLRLFLKKAAILRPGPITALWWSVGAAQALSIVMNGIAGGPHLGEMLRHLLATPVTGWLLLGIAINVGQRYRLNSPAVIRAVCLLGAYLIVLSAGTLAFAALSNWDELAIKSPIALMLPADLPSVESAFTMRFFLNEETMGSTIPRLILFYPWPTCLGFAGIALFFIALQEQNRFWKWIGIAGGLVALIASMSRAAVAGFAIGGAFYLFRKTAFRFQLPLILFICAIAAGSSLFNIQPAQTLSDLNRFVDEVRQGSSDARQMGYDESWHFFLQAPIVGYGWQGDTVAETIPMHLGTHSSVYGTLYTGGLLTFVPFCLATGLTIVTVFRRSNRRSGLQRSALAIALALATMSYSEGIYSFAPFTLFAFCWIGASLNRPGPAHP